jgi:type IV pilus assembly protein PilW
MKRSMQSARRSGGFSLIELMIGMLLGLIVTGAAIAIFLSNQQTYRATEGLGRVQENLRTAYELMAQDLRAAGGNTCNELPANFKNKLTSGTSEWWGTLASADWSSAIKGYASTVGFDVGGPAFGTSEGQRLSGSAAIELFSGGDVAASVAADSGSVFTLNSSSHGFVSGDVLLVCDTNNSAIFNATTVSGTSVTHTTSISYSANATMSRFNAVRWYIAYNGNSGTSLYRSRVYAGSERQEEIADNVSALDLQYLVDGGTEYEDAAEVTDWSTVLAIRVTLSITSPDKVGTDGKVLTRTSTHVVELRNRNA